MNDETLRFYDEQAKGYSEIRARPIQIYTDRLEREAMMPLVAEARDILDLGCGEGRLTRWIAATKRQQGGAFAVHGADFSPEMIVHAEAQNGDLPATYGVGDAMALPFPDNSFDLIVSCTAPNNFPSLDGALDEIRRVLRPGGIFCATIINGEETARFARYLYYSPYYLAQLAKRLVGGASGYHRVLFSRDELASLLRGRFDVMELTGMRVIPDFIPEFPLNIWPPLFPVMNGLVRATEGLDRRLSRHPRAGRHARFHLVIARALK
ncbi:class I SAM-dependent methyltransferase [Bosea sp. WAO]|uniref:class I SAM-dependent methyltransferase n=1 Tax=Bosea sp. WAO TaxID=406341 RepID=UPI00082F5222|nr:class I SAM-dependent methyltransferase [Bosea sp. WAO]